MGSSVQPYVAHWPDGATTWLQLGPLASWLNRSIPLRYRRGGYKIPLFHSSTRFGGQTWWLTQRVFRIPLVLGRRMSLERMSPFLGDYRLQRLWRVPFISTCSSAAAQGDGEFR